jgi:hypothetical protein
LVATSARLPALNKIKKMDAADRTHKISYALGDLGTGGWPSVSAIKKIGSVVHAKLTIRLTPVFRAPSRTGGDLG